MNGFVDKFLHVLRQIAFKAQPVACDGMNEAERRRVQRLAAKIEGFQGRSQPGIGAPIDRVSY